MRARHCLCCVKGEFLGEGRSFRQSDGVPPPPSPQSSPIILFKPTPTYSSLISKCSFPIFSQLFSPHLPMVRAQYLLCRARGEVVTKACGRWGMLKECDWYTVTYLSFRMYLMLIFLPGETEELCLLANPVLLSKFLLSTLSLWLQFILKLNCKRSFRQVITPETVIWRLFTRSSSHSRMTGKKDYSM